jgi:hypothetical protein
MMSRIDSRHWKISTGRHFQNGHHNTAQIQHWTGLKNKLKATFEIEQCWICAVLWWPFWKWRPVEIDFYRSSFSKWLPQYRTNSTLFDFNDISYVGRLWCPEMIPDIEKFLPVTDLFTQYYGFCGTNEYWKNDVCSSVE